jgi:hypothetical protein
MALPPPSIPSDLEPTQIATLSEHNPQNVNADTLTVPSAALQLAEPQRATPSMGPRCEHCVSSPKRPIQTTSYFRAAICHFSHHSDRTCQHLRGQSCFVIRLTRMWRDGERPSSVGSPQQTHFYDLATVVGPFLGPSSYHFDLSGSLGSVLTVIHQSQ